MPELRAHHPKDVELYSAAEQAKTQFKPVVAEEVDKAKQDAILSAKSLESYLQTNAPAWFKTIQWYPDGDVKQFYQTLRLLNWGYKGQELPQFRDLADKIKRYVDLYIATQLKDQKTAYQLQIELLAYDLGNYDPSNSTLELDVCRRLKFIESFDQAPDLISLVLTRHVKPNAFINVSVGLANRFSKSDNKSERISDNILGTKLSIDAKTATNVSIRPVPSLDSAAFEVVVNGTTNSNSTGFNGPAVIKSSALTKFTASQSVFLTDENTRVTKPVARATTNSTINSVTKNGGGLGSGIVARKGTQQARAKQGQSNAEAAKHAESRAEQKLGTEIAQKIGELRKQYDEAVHGSLGRYGLIPEIQYQTTNEYVSSIITQSDYGQVGASDEPPKPHKHHDAVIIVHRSAVNNVLESFLSGAVIQESQVGKRPSISAPIPDRLADIIIPRYDIVSEHPNYKPWTLELSELMPVTVDFTGDLIKITVHTSSIVSGKDEFNGWDITQTMKPVIQPDGSVVATQSGQLVILPSGFDQINGKMTKDQVSLRSALTRVINDRTKAGVGFSTKIEIPTISPEKLGKLTVTEIDMSGGWATIGWDIDVAKKKN